MNVILVDDEQLALEFLQLQLKDLPDITIVGTYTNPADSMHALLYENVDVAFLDIHLPNENGIALAKRIVSEFPDVLIVFITAFEQYAVDAFGINAVDYVVKPIQRKRLNETIERLRQRLKKTDDQEQIVSENMLRINMCNQFRIENLEKPLAWRTARTKELFLLLLQHRDTIVHKEYIAELLWPDVDVERAIAQLYTTVYHVRRVLSDFADHLKLDNGTNGYILVTKNVDIDVYTWEESIKSLPSLRIPTLKMYERIMKQYRASYLQNYSYGWAIPEAERLDRLWINHALQLADFYEQQKDIAHMIEWYTAICERYPEVEEAHFAIMKQHAEDGKTSYVKRQYEELVDALKRELGIRPSRYIEQWYAKWLHRLEKEYEF